MTVLHPHTGSNSSAIPDQIGVRILDFKKMGKRDYQEKNVLQRKGNQQKNQPKNKALPHPFSSREKGVPFFSGRCLKGHLYYSFFGTIIVLCLINTATTVIYKV